MTRFRVVDNSRFSSGFASASPTGRPSAGPSRVVATEVLRRAAILDASEGIRDVLDAADIRDFVSDILGPGRGVDSWPGTETFGPDELRPGGEGEPDTPWETLGVGDDDLLSTGRPGGEMYYGLPNDLTPWDGSARDWYFDTFPRSPGDLVPPPPSDRNRDPAFSGSFLVPWGEGQFEPAQTGPWPGSKWSQEPAPRPPQGERQSQTSRDHDTSAGPASAASSGDRRNAAVPQGGGSWQPKPGAIAPSSSQQSPSAPTGQGGLPPRGQGTPPSLTQPGPDGGGPGYGALARWLLFRLRGAPIVSWPRPPSNAGPRVNPGRDPDAQGGPRSESGPAFAVSPNDAPRPVYARRVRGPAGVLRARQELIDLARPPTPR